jgi:hypothetical protein
MPFPIQDVDFHESVDPIILYCDYLNVLNLQAQISTLAFLSLVLTTTKKLLNEIKIKVYHSLIKLLRGAQKAYIHHKVFVEMTIKKKHSCEETDR